MDRRYTEQEIERLRSTEIEILDVIVNLCEKYSIKYSIAYGTLLGAIRHKGFIPWDDDIDIMMPRKDYERFKRIWKKSKIDGYYLHDYYVDPDFVNNFLKIRKDHTTFYTYNIHENPDMSGIFVDIFPLDRVPNSPLGRIVQFCASAVNLLYSRQYTSGSKGIINVGERILLMVPKKKRIKLRRKAELILRRWNKKKEGMFVSAETIRDCKILFPGDMFDKMIYVDFEGKKYKSVADYDGFLTALFGDYMKLPPPKERVFGHAPDIINFEYSYRELQEKGKITQF